MTLKNPMQGPPGGFVFFYFVGKGKERRAIQVQMSGTGQPTPILQLTECVRASMKNNDVPVPDNLEQIIEHQICVRLENSSEYCWSGGVGDDIHKWAKPFLRSTADVVERAVARVSKNVAIKLGQAIRTLSNCSSCGGTAVYDQNVDNLGRAGKLNSVQKTLQGKI